jgi:hypothetical protein
MTRSQARARTRTAWGWCLPRRRASAYSLAAQGELCRELPAKVVSACRALVLAAHRKATALVLPEARVTGWRRTRRWRARGCRRGVQDRADSATTWARLTSPMRGSGASSLALACPSSPAPSARSRSAMVASRVRSNRTWAPTSSVSTSGASPTGAVGRRGAARGARRGCGHRGRSVAGRTRPGGPRRGGPADSGVG